MEYINVSVTNLETQSEGYIKKFLYHFGHFTLPTLPELRKLLILLVVHQGGLFEKRRKIGRVVE